MLPAIATYRPSIDIAATMLPAIAAYRPSIDIAATMLPAVAAYRPSIDIKKGSCFAVAFFCVVTGRIRLNLLTPVTVIKNYRTTIFSACGPF